MLVVCGIDLVKHVFTRVRESIANSGKPLASVALSGSVESPVQMRVLVPFFGGVSPALQILSFHCLKKK